MELRQQKVRLTKELSSPLKERLQGSKDTALGRTADESKDVSKKPPSNYRILFDQIEARVEQQERELNTESRLVKRQKMVARKSEELWESMETLDGELDALRQSK